MFNQSMPNLFSNIRTPQVPEQVSTDCSPRIVMLCTINSFIRELMKLRHICRPSCILTVIVTDLKNKLQQVLPFSNHVKHILPSSRELTSFIIQQPPSLTHNNMHCVTKTLIKCYIKKLKSPIPKNLDQKMIWRERNYLIDLHPVSCCISSISSGCNITADLFPMVGGVFPKFSEIDSQLPLVQLTVINICSRNLKFT